MPSGPPKERRRRHGKAQPRRLASPPPTRAATASVSPPDPASRTRPPKPRHPESAHHLDHSRPSKPPGSRTLPGGAAWGHALPQRRGLAPAHRRPRQAPGGAASSLPQAQDPAFFHATKPTLATSLAASANDAHGTPPRHGLAPVSTTRRRCVLPASAPSCTRRSASLKPAGEHRVPKPPHTRRMPHWSLLALRRAPGVRPSFFPPVDMRAPRPRRHPRGALHERTRPAAGICTNHLTIPRHSRRPGHAPAQASIFQPCASSL